MRGKIQRIKEILKTNKVFHLQAILVLVISTLLAGTMYKSALVRMWDSWRNLCSSFLSLFSRARRVPGLLLGNSKESYKKVTELLPYDFDELRERLMSFWANFFNSENFTEYLGVFTREAILLFLKLVIAYSLIMALINIFEAIFFNRREKDAHLPTRPLKAYIRYIEEPMSKLIRYIKRFIELFKGKWYYKLIFVLIWMSSFNMFSIIFEFFSWYFSFPFFVSLEGVLLLLAKLLLDSALMLELMPTIVVVYLAYKIFNKIRHDRGKGRLWKFFSMSCALVKALPKAIMFYGSMGAEKTKTMSFWALLLSIIYHDEAYATIHKVQMNFPDFPFLSFENEINQAIENGEIKNLHRCRKFVKKLRKAYESGEHKLYGYSSSLYYDDGVKYVYIFDDLSDYAQCYYIYGFSTSLIISTYPIRDQLVLNNGYFPMLDKSFFDRTADDYEAVSKFSHIVDHDIFRMKKRMNPKNKEHFEFGISCKAENAKERGNKETNKIHDVSDEAPNPLNDGSGLHTRFKRHFATVDFVDYSAELVDDQRTMDLNAYEREPYMHIFIGDKSEVRLALPFFDVEEIINSTFNAWFKEFYHTVRTFGKENTLLIHILRRLASSFDKYYRRIYKRYGYHVTELKSEDGLGEGEVKKYKIYMLYFFVHGYLYATDSYRGFIDDLMEQAEGGLADTPVYDSFYPNISQNLSSKSYLINELYKFISAEEEETKKIEPRATSSKKKLYFKSTVRRRE